MQDPESVGQNLGRRIRALRVKKKLHVKKKWSREDCRARGPARSFTGGIEDDKGPALDALVKSANTFRIPMPQLFK
jgi:hypothetical protein